MALDTVSDHSGIPYYNNPVESFGIFCQRGIQASNKHYFYENHIILEERN